MVLVERTSSTSWNVFCLYVGEYFYIDDKMIYISGPITNEDKDTQKKNMDRFFEVERDFNKKGFTCINPARNGDSPDKTYEYYLAKDLIDIFENEPDFYFLKGWENSRGARLEHEICVQLGLGIRYE